VEHLQSIGTTSSLTSKLMILLLSKLDKDKKNTNRSVVEIKPSLKSTALVDGTSGLVIMPQTGILFSDLHSTTSQIIKITKDLVTEWPLYLQTRLNSTISPPTHIPI